MIVRLNCIKKWEGGGRRKERVDVTLVGLFSNGGIKGDDKSMAAIY